MRQFKWLIPACLLGLSFFLAVLLVKPIGVSTQFSVAAGIVQRTVQPDLVYEEPANSSGYASSNAYLNKSEGKLAKAVVHPLNYGMLFVLAIPLGVALGYYLDPKRKAMREARSVNQGTDLANVENQSGYLKSFLAGLFLIYGARMAGGCTSGHMMSGIMQSSISGFIFAAVVFAIAIPLAMLWSKMGGRNVN